MKNGNQCWKVFASGLTGTMLAAVASAALVTSTAAAETYPSRPIKVILSVPSGSAIDVTARLVTRDLSERLGTPVIVENRPGGGQTIGVQGFVRAAPDGYTLLFGTIGDLFAAKSVGRDPTKDFVAVATASSLAWILVVRPVIPATSVRQLIEHAKANPGKLNWGFGQSTPPHMFGEMFRTATGIDVARISYKSGSQAIPDMLGGRIDMNFGTVSNLLPLVREGKLRAIAITSAARSPDLADVPTMSESGFPQLTRGDWTGFWAPARTPAHIVTRLNSEINAVLTMPAMRAAMRKLDFEPRTASPQEFAAFILNEIETWTPAAKAAGILKH
jgi:tripartite-type tricarboxylate transporter receptor subunit TctC